MPDRPRGPSIGIDAMGGDFAPRAEVDGAIQALAEEPGAFEVVLVGDVAVIEADLARHPGWRNLPIRLVHAPERIEMGDAAALAARRKRNSSLVVATRLHKEGEIDALVSAGNTGAVVATSLFNLGRLEGVDRPAIAALFPVPNTQAGSVVLDVGANSDCKPIHLLQFAIMGTLFARHVLGVKRPRVGLLNIGEEATKGNELAQEAYQLLSATTEDIEFLGNVEGRDVFRGTADVVVCDGFTGNVVLKTAESVAELLVTWLRRELKSDPVSLLGGLMSRAAFRRLRARMDYAEYGGAPLLGVNGVVIIAHGSSSSKAITNAIRTAAVAVTHQVNAHIRQELKVAHG
ncbi:MAG TPA: phosphate acyltransferase PlsX [Candidatus Saccharimonadales bacterium]|nr:phosphate acyltransferase PlsX [Candidatus Saccharimonadales bacterium]